MDSGRVRQLSTPYRPNGNIVQHKDSESEHEMARFDSTKIPQNVGKSQKEYNVSPPVVEFSEEEQLQDDDMSNQPGAFNAEGNLPATCQRSIPSTVIESGTATTDEQPQNNGSVDDVSPIEAYVPGNRNNRKRGSTQIIEGVLEKVSPSNSRMTLVACLLFMAIGLVLGLAFGLTKKTGKNEEQIDLKQPATAQQNAVRNASPAPSTTEVPSILPSTSSMPSPGPSNVPTSTEFEAVLEQLQIEFPKLPVNVSDSTSPSYRAAEFLVGRFELPFSRYHDFWIRMEFRQRYALAVLYYATGGGESWIEDCNFMSDAHHCYWTCPLPESSSIVTIDITDDNFMGVKCLFDEEDGTPLLSTGLALCKILIE